MLSGPAGSRRECNPQPLIAVSSARKWPSSSSCGAPAWPRLPPPSLLQRPVWTASSSSHNNKLPENSARVRRCSLATGVKRRRSDSLYLVFVCSEQFSGHLSVTRTGPKRLGQHCSFRHTLRQKSGIWSARRTIRRVERYVFPLYLRMFSCGHLAGRQTGRDRP